MNNLNYIDFSDRSHWNGDGVRAARETQKQYNDLKKKSRHKKKATFSNDNTIKSFDDMVEDAKNGKPTR